MHASRREARILETVRLRGACSVAELASLLEVSDETIRRDVRPLVSRGLVRKVHGGITLPDTWAEPPFQRRMLENREAKQRIAARVAREIGDGDALVLDTGSTTAYVALALAGHSNLLVVTNCVEIARTLATRNGNRVIMCGGELRADDGAAFGPTALETVRRFEVRHAVLSIGAIGVNGTFTDHHVCEGDFSRAATAQAERTIVAADRSKFAAKAAPRAAVTVCEPGDVDMLVTDHEPPARHARSLRDAGVELIVA